MSFQDPDSELSQLNGARGARVRLSRLTLRTLRLARAMMLASDGLFNCTVGGALIECGRLPDHRGGPWIHAGTSADIELFNDGARLRRGVCVTLDGIAKGFAVDLALATLRKLGVGNAWVNAGGDVRVMGRYALPVRARGAPLQVALCDGALATSATGVHDVSLPGAIVGNDGAPATPGEWSVLAHRAWRADALTKVAALAPASIRAALLQRLGGRLIDYRAQARAPRVA
jgi:thiamine biosynthesis lipoprotein